MADGGEKSNESVVTLMDVAREAGVSRATASLVVRNSPLVAEKTRSRVLDAMQKLGYVYNRAAAALRTRDTGTIALVVPDIRNPYFAEITVGVQDAFDERGSSVFLANTSDDLARQNRRLGRLLELQVDGVILCPARMTKNVDLAPLAASGIPVVLVSRRVRGARFDYVGPDNIRCGRLAAEHLLSLGHRRIAFLGGEAGSSARMERMKGVEEAIAGRGGCIPEDWKPECPPTRHAATAATASLFAHSSGPTAIVAYNDVAALGVMDGLFRIGMEPGTHCAVVGFDGIEEASQARPSLSTVAVTPSTVAERAVAQLEQRRCDRSAPCRTILLEGRLIARDTSAAPPGAHPESP